MFGHRNPGDPHRNIYDLYRKLRYYRNLRWPIFQFMLHRKPDYHHRSKLMSTVNYGGAVIYGGAWTQMCNCHVLFGLGVSFGIILIIDGS